MQLENRQEQVKPLCLKNSEEKLCQIIKHKLLLLRVGSSGLSAAVQAAEDGAEVIVVEKAAAIGGAANMGMGPLGIGTRYQKQQMEDITVEKSIQYVYGVYAL